MEWSEIILDISCSAYVSFQEGSWIWSTSGLKMDWSNWQNGKPDNNEGIENCLYLGDISNHFKWDDAPCIQNSKRPLCQKLKTLQ